MKQLSPSPLTEAKRKILVVVFVRLKDSFTVQYQGSQYGKIKIYHDMMSHLWLTVITHRQMLDEGWFYDVWMEWSFSHGSWACNESMCVLWCGNYTSIHCWLGPSFFTNQSSFNDTSFKEKLVCAITGNIRYFSKERLLKHKDSHCTTSQALTHHQNSFQRYNDKSTHYGYQIANSASATTIILQRCIQNCYPIYLRVQDSSQTVNNKLSEKRHDLRTSSYL